MAKTCYECTEKNPAHSLCTKCNKWLCSTCAEQHRHGKASGEHYLAASQRGSEGSSNHLICPIHSQEPLKLFCESCDVLMCRHCLVLEHKDHRFRRLDEALQNQRVLLENVITQVEEKKIVVQAAGKQIEERLYELKHMHRKVENQIKMTKMVIINELNKRMNSMLEQLEKITSEKQQKFEQQLQSVLLLNRQLEHVQNFVNWAMYSKNSVPFLFSKELIVFQMQRLLETSCGSDFGRPLKMKFSWEPSFWTKQISNLGCILTDTVHLPPSEVPTYGPIEDVQSPYYQAHHPVPATHLATISSSQSYAPTVQCPTPVCCAHCHTLPSITKSQTANSTVSHHMNFTHSTTVKQQVVQPIQYSSGKEQKCLSRPLRVIQPWLPNPPPPSEPETSPYWSDNQQQQRAAIQPPIQNVAPVAPICSVTSQDFSQVHTAIPLNTATPLPATSVQMQLGPMHSVQQQRHSNQSQTTVCPPEPGQEPVMHHSLDLINQQFELEQMQKGLELLLQSQPSNVQLNQSKQPQHVQQTIVGQINYIVRQPAALPLQSQEEVPQVCEEPISPGGHTVDLSPVAAHSPGIPQSQSIADEIIAAVESDACRRNQLSANPARKRSASESFSNSPEPELSSPRLSRSVDPQMQGVPCQFFSQPPPERCYSAEGETERMAAYGAVEAAVAEEMHLEPNNHLATGGALLGNAICKIENENFSCSGPPPPPPPPPLPPDSTVGSALGDMVLPLDNMFEEPINLCIKKNFPPDPSTAPRRDPAPPQSVIKEIKNETDTENRFQKEKQQDNTSRSEPKETKIPYVRLERLKIYPPPSGELPVFKVQPQTKDEDGSLRLLVKYGARYKSMSIKVNADNSSSSAEISPHPTIPYGSDHVPPAAAHPVPAPPPHPFPRIQSYTGGSQEIKHIVEPEPEPPQECKMSSAPPKKTDHIENEDFCAVCLNGGEMLCCDTCPKVYHLSCHVPALLSFPGGEWVCTLCRNLNKPEVEYDCDNTRYSRENKIEEGMLPHLDAVDERRCEKLVLSLYCNSLSVPFQEPVSPVIIKRPMDLSIIRKKLQKRHIPHYSAPEELVSDIRLMFWNCAKFNYEDSEVAEAGRNLQMCFENMLKETYPGRTFPFPQDEDSETEEIGAENCPLNLKNFHWPNYGPDCVQPKRRRRHPMGQKTRDFNLC
ncbi:tripartite motif-containing protein 66 isoform X2 [Hyla sarda]|uniref:tripartite motif-containing protein 66 isoform X2 n=1 Tax=Hyla sarda TaxID=327740 RepID=UPI0024C282CA|nr:tripartite motif-containing protein 66 isoform X2 [Hyla sarda]